MSSRHRVATFGLASLATFGAFAGATIIPTGSASAATSAVVTSGVASPTQRLPLRTVAETIGITVEALRAQLATGSSIAQVAANNGSSGQAVVDALVAKAKARLDAAVAAGRITQAQADAKLATERTRITTHVNTAPTPGQRPDGGRRG